MKYTASWKKSFLAVAAAVLTVSCKLCGEYSERNVFIGVPAIIGRNGVKEIIELDLTEEEQGRFSSSAKLLNDCFEELEL